MKHSIKTGFSFGTTSGIITTLGLMVGLHSGTHSQLVVMGGILTIAIADAFSDALGIHISEESETKHSHKEIWEATISTFLCKFFSALIFIVPVYFLDLTMAIVVSVVFGLLIMSLISYKLASEKYGKPWRIVLEHLIIAIVVIISTHYTGSFLASTF